jgi:hypothetical protein
MHDGHRRARARYCFLSTAQLRESEHDRRLYRPRVRLRSGAYTHPPTPASTHKRAHARTRYTPSPAMLIRTERAGTNRTQTCADGRPAIAQTAPTALCHSLLGYSGVVGFHAGRTRRWSLGTTARWVVSPRCSRRDCRRSSHRFDTETQADRNLRAVPFSARHVLSLSEVAHVHTHSHAHTCTRVDGSGTGHICLSYRAARDLCFLI